MSYKEDTHSLLIQKYEELGLQKMITIARAMLENTDYKKSTDFIAHMHGEVCETVLECIVLDYMKTYNLEKYGWFYKKGLILRDVNHLDSNYFTELDLTVFTPQKIFAFECKSYGGDKKITDKCTIRKKKGGTFDVYDQHEKHFKVLADQLHPFRIINPQNAKFAPYQLVLFDFATGKTDDVRTLPNKIIMPCLDETNVTNIFKLNYNKPVMWDIVRVHRAIDIIASHTKENTKKHLKYVKGLKHDK